MLICKRQKTVCSGRNKISIIAITNEVSTSFSEKANQINNLYSILSAFSGDVTLTNGTTITLSQSIIGYKNVIVYSGREMEIRRCLI